jgi:MFS family permease
LESDLNTWQIGIIESILHFTIVIFEVPTGIFVDVFGRKKGLIIGRVFLIMYVGFLVIFRNFYGIMMGFILLGISETFMSGTSTAVLYDNITESEKNDDKFTLKMNSRTDLIISLGLAIAFFTGGLLKKISWNVVYIGIIITQIIAIFSIGLIKEKDSLKKDNEAQGKKINLKEIYSDFVFIIRSKKVRNIAIGMMIFSGMLSTFYLFCPIELKALGFSTSTISYIIGIDSLISMYVYYKIEKISERINGELVIKYVPMILAIIFAISVLTWSKYVAIVVFLLICNIGIIITPITSTLINKELNSKTRATVLSSISFLESMITMLLFPVTGFLYQEIAFGKILIIYLIITMISLVFMNKYINEMKISENAKKIEELKVK